MTQALCHHCTEGHFPLEWNGGWCRPNHIFSTNRPNAAIESSKFCCLPAAPFSEKPQKLPPLWMQTHEYFHEVDHLCRVDEYFFVTGTLSCHSKLHLNCKSSSVHCCLVLSVHEMPFWPLSTHCWLCSLSLFFLKWICAERRFLSLSKL